LADDIRTGKISINSPEFDEAEQRVKDQINNFLNNNGSKSVDHFHKRLGLIMWNKVGMGRNTEGLNEAIREIAALREEFYKEVYVPGSADELNPELDKAMRVADFIELGQLMAMDALQRNESCGGHFREEYQDAEGETLRDDANFSFVGAWEYKGQDISKAELHKEELKYEFIKIAARNYK
jgi:succinate dehydrogenase / fumarate reductase flavoprotein subunit